MTGVQRWALPILFFVEQGKDGGFFSPSHYPVEGMSTLTIHDFRTWSGYWHCNDLELGKGLGLYPTEEILQPLYVSRHDNKQQILNTLHGHGAISHNVSHQVEHVGMTQELNYGMQTHMATGSSALLSLQQETWYMEAHAPSLAYLFTRRLCGGSSNSTEDERLQS